MLGILSTCLLVVAPGIDTYGQKRLEREMKHGLNGIIEFINGCKSYARNNSDKSLKIVIDERKIRLFQNTVLVDQLILPESVKVRLPLQNSISIDISKSGHIKTANTIELYNSDGDKEIITIKVGTGYVSKKKE